MELQARHFLESRCPGHDATWRIVLTRITGGLESKVARATVNGWQRHPSDIPRRFVIKELRGEQRRELAVYHHLWREGSAPPAARLYGASQSKDADYLFLEEVRPFRRWPWSDTIRAANVCCVLAALHREQPPAASTFWDWDYESSLRHCAAGTLATAITARDWEGNRLWRRLGDLRRVVGALPDIRRELLGDRLALIHGDMHPGNVLLRHRAAASEVVLIDWARARLGSPLEDVASWLHSLGCWEPQARRRHDLLLQTYLAARGESRQLTAKFRTHYWYASATNGLAGAILYHLSVLGAPASSPHLREHSRRALAEWERVIRRVASILATIDRR